MRNNRQTRQEGTSTTAATAAYSVFDLLRQGKFLLPVARAPARKAASRLLQRPRARKKRSSPRRHPRRAALHPAFPERHPLLKDLTHPPALRCLQTTPTPAAVLSNGRTGFLERWQRRRHCGQWRSDTCHTSYALAQDSLGLPAPYHLAAFASTALAQELADALAKPQMALEKVRELLAPRPAFPLLAPLPRLGRPTAAALLTALGDSSAYTNGPQPVKLAGLDICWDDSGSRIRKLPKLSHVGRAYRRYWLSH